MAGAAGWALAAGFVKVYETELTRPNQRNAASGLEASLGNGGRSTHVECGNLQAHRSSYPISSSSPFFKRVHPLDLLLGQADIKPAALDGRSPRWPQLRPRAALRFTALRRACHGRTSKCGKEQRG